jgi:hypothetical protein
MIKGRNWIDTSETMWCSLIKTTQTVQQTHWVEVWVPCNYPPIERNIDPDCGEWVWVQQTYTTTINYPSDGLLPKYTQIMKNNPTANNTYYVSGANHIEVRNMTKDGNGTDETKEQFDDIFDRTDWFKTN